MSVDEEKQVGVGAGSANTTSAGGKVVVTALETTKKRSSFDSFEKVLENTGEADVSAVKLTFFQKLASRMMQNAEVKGIELVTDEEKVDSSLWNAGTMWLSADLVIATFALGALGITVFTLSFWQAVLVIIFFSMLGAFPVAFFSVFGPKLGLRQMVLTKLLIGDWTMRLFALINMVACVGWGAVNIMSAAQLLNIVNDGACPPWAGCLILVLCTILVSFFGYHVIHFYQKWSWILNISIFIAIACRMGMSGNFTYGEMKGGATTAGNVLSFGGAIFGFATGWTTYGSDYTVYQPRNANPWKIFFAIYAGLMFPLLFALILGAACATGTLTDSKWEQMYNDKSVGGLVYSILVDKSLHGFGQFLCVLLALSSVSNNIPNMYSIALSAQAMWSPLAKIPRVLWTIAGNFVTLAICIPGYYNFEDIMDNFMNLISYYLAIYQAMCFSEHLIYNKGDFSKYDYEHVNDKSRYPIGMAGIFGFCCGVAGVVLGMGNTWYYGVVGRQIGDYGGDIGFELGFVFSFIGYNIARPLEKKYFR